MATQRQIEANRRNALKSTGPRTEAGRARSRLNALKHGLSRKLPPAQGTDPRVAPLAQAILGEGVTDPLALAVAEEVALLSLTLSSIHGLRAPLVASAGGSGLHASCGAHEAPPGADPIGQLRALERFERQALARRSRALARLDEVLARLRGCEDR
jgi:hypothetical protein